MEQFIVTAAPMLVLYRATVIREQQIEGAVAAQGYSRARAGETAPSQLELVAAMVRRFMTLVRFGGRPTAMDWIMRLRTYGMVVRYGTNADGVVDWHGDTLLRGHIHGGVAVDGARDGADGTRRVADA